MKKIVLISLSVFLIFTGCKKEETRLLSDIIGDQYWISDKIPLDPDLYNNADYHFVIKLFKTGKYDLFLTIDDQINGYYSKSGYTYILDDSKNEITLMYPDPDVPANVQSGDPIMFKVSMTDRSMSWKLITVLEPGRVMTGLFEPVINWNITDDFNPAG